MRTHAQAHKLLPSMWVVLDNYARLFACVHKNGAVVRNSSCKCVFCAERERVLVGNDENTKTTPNIPTGCVVGKELDTNMLMHRSHTQVAPWLKTATAHRRLLCVVRRAFSTPRKVRDTSSMALSVAHTLVLYSGLTKMATPGPAFPDQLCVESNAPCTVATLPS